MSENGMASVLQEFRHELVCRPARNAPRLYVGFGCGDSGFCQRFLHFVEGVRENDDMAGVLFRMT